MFPFPTLYILISIWTVSGKLGTQLPDQQGFILSGHFYFLAKLKKFKYLMLVQPKIRPFLPQKLSLYFLTAQPFFFLENFRSQYFSFFFFPLSSEPSD